MKLLFTLIGEHPVLAIFATLVILALLSNGGEKGRQLGILTAGVYRINIALFTVITSANAADHGMNVGDLALHRVEPDMVGIVTTLDGKPIEAGEIAGPVIPEHDNF